MENCKELEFSLVRHCFNKLQILLIFYRGVIKVFTTMNCWFELLFIDVGSSDDMLEHNWKFIEKVSGRFKP